MTAVHPTSANAFSRARIMPKGVLCARHSATSSLYRGSKICKGRGAPGKSTTSSGNRGSKLTQAILSVLWYGSKPVRCIRLQHLDLTRGLKLQSRDETSEQSSGYYRRVDGNRRSHRQTVPAGRRKTRAVRARSGAGGGRGAAHRRRRRE